MEYATVLRAREVTYYEDGDLFFDWYNPNNLYQGRYSTKACYLKVFHRREGQ